jgi:LysM repeat protein
MTERGLPSADASPACPFVAFEDDRDARADRPDHRHRCFAEPEPAPRALAHQEAYCLSSAFPVCPVFQGWARREAAHARVVETPAAAAPPSDPTPSETEHRADEWASPPPSTDDDQAPLPPEPRRNPPRDWAAPPPWATGAAGGAGAVSSGRPAADDPAGTPDFLTKRSTEGQGLAGSAADRLARGDTLGASRSTPPDPELAGLVASGTASAMPLSADERIEAERTRERDAEMAAYARAVESSAAKVKRRSVSSTRSNHGPRDAASGPHVPVQHEGPSWEKARRYEAYPQIRGGSSLASLAGGIPRVALLAGALALAAIALFFLPALFGVGDDGGSSPSPSASSPTVTASPEPTPTPAPTPQTYVIQQGDTLSAIAAEFGITLEELLAANEGTIEDPNRISAGQEIIIPIPTPEEVGGGSAAPTEEATPAP